MIYGNHAALATILYFDRTFGTQAVKVLPGEYYATSENMVLVTVLGSCVAACVRDTQTGIGGINHFMLPDGCTSDNVPVSRAARYGRYAMQILLDHISTLGAHRATLEAKVFGGSNVRAGPSTSNIGQRNAQFALRYLENESIPVVACDLADIHPRKIYYFPRTGRVLVRKLFELHNQTIGLREASYDAQLQKSTSGGTAELFG